MLRRRQKFTQGGMAPCKNFAYMKIAMPPPQIGDAGANRIRRAAHWPVLVGALLLILLWLSLAAYVQAHVEASMGRVLAAVRPLAAAGQIVPVERPRAAAQPLISEARASESVAPVSDTVPDPAKCTTDNERKAAEQALKYMALIPGTPISEVVIDRVFIGSCTNSRIEDLRAAAKVAAGYHVPASVNAMVVPGSGQVKQQAEAEGLDKIFVDAGFEWREAGCSMCLAMNPDTLSPGQRCASTSNRNFEGRQGKGGRTHLVSPAMAAAAAVSGHFVDIRNWEYK